MTKAQQAEQQDALARIREIVKPGDTIYCVLAHVARSGMSREIKLYHHGPDGHSWLSGLVARAGIAKLGKRGGNIMGGCGMDMGFALVYELGYALWPHGTAQPHGTRNGEPDTEGGYALKSRWL
jgi:hypothetical protein